MIFNLNLFYGEDQDSMSMATISVIIPAYNRIDTIGRALASVFTQSRLPDEVIVVDDGSIDGTPDWVSEHYPQVKLIRQSNQGASSARNTGIRESKGEWIAFLDSDDVWFPDKLLLQEKVITKDPQIGLLATRKYKNRNDYHIESVLNPPVRYFPFTAFLKRTTINTPTIMVSRKVLDTVGIFDEALNTSEDWDLWARIAYHFQVARIEIPLVAVFESENSISLSRKTKYFNDVKVLSRWNPLRPDTYDVHRKINPLIYQRYVVTFSILRGIRLLKHVGPKETFEFLSEVEEQIGMTPLVRTVIYNTLKVAGLKK